MMSIDMLEPWAQVSLEFLEYVERLTAYVSSNQFRLKRKFSDTYT
jgi:hypothetical protein